MPSAIGRRDSKTRKYEAERACLPGPAEDIRWERRDDDSNEYMVLDYKVLAYAKTRRHLKEYLILL